MSNEFEQHPQRHLVGPLIAIRDDEAHRIEGTAFLIGPGLALTARHVLESYLWAFQGERIEVTKGHRSHRDVDLDCQIHVLIRKHNNEHRTFYAKQIHFLGSGDIAVLRLDAPKEFDWSPFGPFPTLDMFAPPVGTVVQVLGYPSSSSELVSPRHFNFHTWPRLAEGRVEQIWNKPRDQRLLWFPAFEVSAQINGGMSGGPALDPTGKICGVSTRSWTFAEDDLGPPVGYVATLWPSALIPVPRPAQQGDDARRLYDLMKRGVVAAVGLDRLNLAFDETGRIGVQARPPRESLGCDEQEEASG